MMSELWSYAHLFLWLEKKGNRKYLFLEERTALSHNYAVCFILKTMPEDVFK